MFPVDRPDVDDLSSDLDPSALEDQSFSSHSGQVQVPVSPGNVTRLQVFDDAQPAASVLALHPPDDPETVLALFLQDTWWTLDDVLRTSSPSRRGLVSVRSVTERLIVFLLSRVVERPGGEAWFSLHPRTESCKVLWSAGEAVGFYSVKHKGSLCGGWSSSSYALPVLDSLQVRSRCRRRGFALLMLDDFCSTFSTQELLGLSCPLSSNMAAVMLKFLRRRVEERERLYEVEAPGGWGQRRNIWLGLRLGRYARDGGGAGPQGGGPAAGPAPSGCCDGGVTEEEEEEEEEEEVHENRNPDVQNQTLDRQNRTPDVQNQTPDFQNQTPDVQARTLSTGPQAEPDPTGSGRMSGTGSGSAAHAERSPSSESPPARRRPEEPEGRARTAKRARRT